MLDADEFLFVCGNRNLYRFVDEFMKEHPDAGGLGVNWLMFGSSGHEKKPEGGMLKNFLMCSEKNYIGNFNVKTICAPLRVLAWLSPHSPVYRKGFCNLDSAGETINDAFTREVHHETIRINHYCTRSKEEFTEKIKRGLADRKHNTRSMEDFYKIDRNDVRDTEILSNI